MIGFNQIGSFQINNVSMFGISIDYDISNGVLSVYIKSKKYDLFYIGKKISMIFKGKV